MVRDNKVAHIENLYTYKNESQFRNDVDFLCKNYCQVTSLDDLRNHNKGCFLLSFDDGLSEIYTVVFPILKEKGVRAIFFINPNFVDNNESLYKHDISVIISYLRKHGFPDEMLKKVDAILPMQYESNEAFIAQFKNTKFVDRGKIKAILDSLGIDMQNYLNQTKPYITKEQIQEMIDAGFWFGGHTMSHPPLGQLSHDEQKAEIIESIDWLKKNFGIAYSTFAFPFTDKTASTKLIKELFAYEKDLILFGNSGLKKNIDSRIIHRFSIENPSKEIAKTIVSENLYKRFNKLIGKYRIARN